MVADDICHIKEKTFINAVLNKSHAYSLKLTDKIIDIYYSAVLVLVSPMSTEIDVVSWIKGICRIYNLIL